MKNENLTESVLFHVTPETKEKIKKLPRNINLSAILREYVEKYVNGLDTTVIAIHSVVSEVVDEIVEEISSSDTTPAENDIEEIEE